MTKKETVYRYTLKVDERGHSHKVNLVPYDKTTGDHFKVYRSPEDKLWYWNLYLAYSRHSAAARSGTGYRTRQTAEGSIQSAFRAMQGAITEEIFEPG